MCSWAQSYKPHACVLPHLFMCFESSIVLFKPKKKWKCTLQPEKNLSIFLVPPSGEVVGKTMYMYTWHGYTCSVPWTGKFSCKIVHIWLKIFDIVIFCSCVLPYCFWSLSKHLLSTCWSLCVQHLHILGLMLKNGVFPADVLHDVYMQCLGFIMYTI